MGKDQYIDEFVPPQERVEIMESYVCEAVNDPLVRELAFKFAAENPANPAQGILDGQNRVIRYELDCGDGTCEILRTARDTLTRGGGDCKKKSIVTAAMLRIVGIQSIVVWLDQESKGFSNNHVAVQACKVGVPKHGADTAVQVYLPEKATECNGGWIWVETTLPGAKVGADPYQEFQRLKGNTSKREIL